MTAAAVTRSALVLSLAVHLVLLGLPGASNVSPPPRPVQELLSVRLIPAPAVQAVETRKPVKKEQVPPVSRQSADKRNQQQHQTSAPVQVPAQATAPAQTETAVHTVATTAPAPRQLTNNPAATAVPKQAPTQTAQPPPRRNEYLELVRSLVERNKEYPSFARQAGQQGTVLVRVQINESGSASAVSLLQSSGHSHLDRAALSAVKQAAPFKPPAGFGLGSISIDIPIVYKLT